MPNDVSEIIPYCRALLREQEATMLAGTMNTIEEYKAGAATIRNLNRILVKCQEILAGKSAAEAAEETNLTEMPEHK